MLASYPPSICLSQKRRINRSSGREGLGKGDKGGRIKATKCGHDKAQSYQNGLGGLTVYTLDDGDALGGTLRLGASILAVAIAGDAALVAVGLSLVVLDLGLPLAQVVLGIVEDLAGLATVLVRGAGIAGNNRSVVEQLEQALAVAGEDNLLLGALNGGSKLGLKGLLELLARNVGELGLGHQVLGLGADELLLEDHETGAVGLLGLEQGDLVGNLGLVVAAGLDALLGIADGLEHSTAVVEGVGVLVLLLANLGQNNTDLVANVRHGIVVRLLTPLGQLGGNRHTLAARSLVRADQVVLGLDQTVELLGQLGLRGAAQRRERKAAAAAAGTALAAVALGANGKAAVPGRRLAGVYESLFCFNSKRIKNFVLLAARSREPGQNVGHGRQFSVNSVLTTELKLQGVVDQEW